MSDAIYDVCLACVPLWHWDTNGLQAIIEFRTRRSQDLRYFTMRISYRDGVLLCGAVDGLAKDEEIDERVLWRLAQEALSASGEANRHPSLGNHRKARPQVAPQPTARDWDSVGDSTHRA